MQDKKHLLNSIIEARAAIDRALNSSVASETFEKLLEAKDKLLLAYLLVIKPK